MPEDETTQGPEAPAESTPSTGETPAKKAAAKKATAKKAVAKKTATKKTAAKKTATRKTAAKAAVAPADCATINPGTSAGRMPANVSVRARANVTAGFANDVDAVNQYAAVM